MEQEEILGVMDSFKFDKLLLESKVNFIETIFNVNIDPMEVQFSKEILAEIIQTRLLMDEVCPECHGWGCESCRGTGKNIQAIYK